VKARRDEATRAEGADETVHYEVADRVATVTLNRPEALNAVTMDMEKLLVERLREADADPGVGCILLTGEGRGFCAGDDIKVQWADPRMEESLARLGTPEVGLSPFVEVLLRGTTPTVAAVNGAAVGLGMDLALLCDIRVASPAAKFSQGYIRMGLLPDVAGLWLLPRLIGPSMAAELLLTGDIIDGHEALRLGLVSRLVEPDELVPAAAKLAGRIAAMPPLAVAATKEGIRRATGLSMDELGGLAAIRGVRLRDLFQTDDHKEAAAAFTERREPHFHGR
jgi:enoyl-CoA hydratase/carnithine racemase